MPSSARCKSPACRRESLFSFWCFFLLTLLLLPIIHTDACGAPLRYETMRLKDTSTKDSYATNETVEYICRVGYRRNFMSSMTAVCNANNSWTPLQEVCIKKLCSSPGDPLNGYVTMTNGTLEFGSQVDFTCEDGYHLIGRKTLYCEVIGDSVGWSDNPPICDRVKCVPPPNIENGIYRTSGKDVYEYNEVVNYECNSLSGPDQYSLIGNKVLYCTGNGEWSSKPPVCKVVKCDYPVIRNGDRVVGLGSRFTYKSQVVFQCHQGYVMKGSNTIICEENSTWVPPVPTCIKELPPPTTQPPILSHSVSTTPLSTLHNTTSPFLSPAGMPTSTSSSTTRVPGLPPSTQEPPVSGLLDGGSIAVIVVAIFIAVTVVAIFMYKYRHRSKRGKAEVTAEYTPCKDVSTTPAEQES